MVSIDVTRTRSVRERLTLDVDAAEWERIFGTPLNPGTVNGLQVNEFFDALGAKPRVLSTDIDSDVWTAVAVTPNDGLSDDPVAVTRYQYDRARVRVSETLTALHAAQLNQRFAVESYGDAEVDEAALIDALSVAEFLALDRG